jgi:photosystem II stability/assembly factor-like uncharacterized protein
MKFRALIFLSFFSLFIISCAKKVVKPDLVVMKATLLTNSPANCYAMHFADAHNGILACGDDLWKTTDGGLSWHQTMDISSLGTLVSVEYPNEDTAYFLIRAVTSPYHTTVYRSTDGAETWTAQMVMSQDFYASFYDGKHGYGFGELLPSSIYNYLSTSNSATTWTVHAATIPAHHPSYINFINATTGVAQAGYYQYNTFDGGQTWNSTLYGDQHFWPVIYPGGVVFSSDDDYNLLKSSDYGTTWKKVFTTGGYAVTYIDFSSSGFCCGVCQGKLIISRDFGETWMPVIEDAEPREGVLDEFALGSLHILDDHTIIATGYLTGYTYRIARIEIE